MTDGKTEGLAIKTGRRNRTWLSAEERLCGQSDLAVPENEHFSRLVANTEQLQKHIRENVNRRPQGSRSYGTRTKQGSCGGRTRNVATRQLNMSNNARLRDHSSFCLYFFYTTFGIA